MISAFLMEVVQVHLMNSASFLEIHLIISASFLEAHLMISVSSYHLQQ